MKKLVLFLLGGALVAVALGGEVPKVLAEGADLPAFSLRGIDGELHTEEEYADAKVLCLIFTCNHCPDAMAAASRMEEIYQDYKDKGVAVVAVNSNNPESLRPNELGYSIYGDSFEEMVPFAEGFGWTFPYLYDGERQELAVACGAQATPHVFVFDEGRQLRYSGRMDDARRSAGAVDVSFVRDVFDALLAGGKVKEPVTRAFGCSTKWLFKKEKVIAAEEEWKRQSVVLESMDVELAKKIRVNKSGNVRVMNFWSTYCGPCVEEFPELVDVYRRFENRNLDFVSVSMDSISNRELVRGFLESRHAGIPRRMGASMKKEGRSSMHYIWDGGNPDSLAEAVFPEWTGALPLTLILSEEGKVLWSSEMAVDAVELRGEILKALE